MKRNSNAMKKNTDRFNPKLAVGDRISGYIIQKIVELPEIASFFYELEHRPTGARHIHISRADKENSFCVAFKTVPEDATGVAHILEHTVLCGSEKYPVRDPFFAMIKRSLSSFMNALTASDWTMYPFSTQNKKDYHNLMKVYLDATFFPSFPGTTHVAPVWKHRLQNHSAWSYPLGKRIPTEPRWANETRAASFRQSRSTSTRIVGSRSN